MHAAITTKGRLTIPKAIRQHLGLKPGDRVKLFLRDDGSVVLLPKLPASALRGMVNPRRPQVTIDEMTEAAASGAVDGAMSGDRRSLGWIPTSSFDTSPRMIQCSRRGRPN